jgi:hypothetical protein
MENGYAQNVYSLNNRVDQSCFQQISYKRKWALFFFSVSGIAIPGGIFLLLASLQIVPQGANAISHISPGGQIISGTAMAIGSLSGGYAIYLWIKGVKSPPSLVTEAEEGTSTAAKPTVKATTSGLVKPEVEEGTSTAAKPTVKATTSRLVKPEVEEGTSSAAKPEVARVSSPLVVEIKKNKLQVEEIPPSGREEIKKIAKIWRSSALKKYKQCHGGELPKFKTTEEERALNTTAPSAPLRQCCSLTQLIDEALSGKEVEETWDTVLVCRDQDQKVQAIALIDKKKNELAYLVTHPDNIRHEINENITTRVEGTGIAIILYLAKEALQINKPIRLIATQGVFPFYQKLHFAPYPRETYPNHYPMELTVEKIKQLIEECVFPFDRLSVEEEKESSDDAS